MARADEPASPSSPSHEDDAEMMSPYSSHGEEVASDDTKQQWLSWTEVKIQCTLAGPLIFGNILSFLLPMVCVVFVGHTGELQLSAASLANSFAVVIGYSSLLGMSTALETLCGQAFGAQQYRKLGVFMQRSMVVLNAISVLLAILFIYIEQIFVAVGQDAELASKAADYGLWLIPNLFAFSFYFPLVRFLQAQSLVIPIFICFALTLLCHVPICWALVFKSSLGYKGAALANSISDWITVFLLALYVKFSKKCAACRASFSFEVLQDLQGFLKLAIPSAMMMCLEWWSYEILVIISGFLSNPKLQTGIISICVNSELLLYNIPFGMAGAVSTRVSNELGAGNLKAARVAVNVSRILALGEAIILIAFLLLVRNVWGVIYSNDKEVVHAVTSFIPFFATSSAFDALQAVLSGVLRGAGWQQAGAYMNLGSFYIAGLPTGCLLAFVARLEGKGLWLGLIVGTFAQFVAYAVFIQFLDWKEEAKRAAARVGGPASATQPLLMAES